jgi:hypothetical protein
MQFGISILFISLVSWFFDDYLLRNDVSIQLLSFKVLDHDDLAVVIFEMYHKLLELTHSKNSEG